MKKLATSLIIVASLLVACDLKAIKIAPSADIPHPTASPQAPVSKLTAAEEDDLKRLLSIALLFYEQTRLSISGCLEGTVTKEVDIAEIIRERQRQNIELRLITRENSLIVIVDSLHIYLVFPRLHDLGLAPPEKRTFCEKTYEDSVATQRQYRYFKSSDKYVEGDPGLTSIVAGINSRYPAPDYDRTSRKEVGQYVMPMLTSKAVEPYATWSEEKKALYERIIEVARHYALLHCQPRKPVSMIVPDFVIGDPEIYLLLEAPGSFNSIEWISLTRDVFTGKYIAQHAKNFGLPDEIKTLSPLIKARQVEQVIVKCEDR